MHVPTLEWSLVLVLVTVGTLGLLLARQRKDRSITLWALGYLGNGLGFLVPLLSLGAPPTVQAILSGSFYFAFGPGLLVGLGYALGEPRTWKVRHGFYVAVWGVALAAHSVWDPLGLSLVALVSVFDGLFALECVVLTLNSTASLARLLRRPLVVLALLYVGWQWGLALAAWAALGPRWLPAEDLNLVVLGSSLAFSVVWAGGVLMLDGIRIEARLGAQAEELRRLNGLKDRVLAMASHDLRGPLSNLRALWSELAGRLSAEGGDVVERELLTMVDRSLAGTQSLLENLFVFAESQRTEPDPRAVAEARSIAQSVHDQWIAPAQAKGVDLVLEPGPSLLVHAEVEGLHTVLRNLVGNAIKFTPAGGSVTLRLCAGTEPWIDVVDTGIGMDPEALRLSFELGSRTSRPGTSGERGSGFGLPLVKELVGSWGGRLEVDSAPGQGTVVRVRLAPAV